MAIIERILSNLRRESSNSKQDQATPATKLVFSSGTGKDSSCKREPFHAGKILKDRQKRFTGIIAECSIVSIPNSEVHSNLESFAGGKQRRIMLERELSNKYDRTAIKVIGVWQDETRLVHIGQIGWVPSELAHKIAVIPADTAIHANMTASFNPVQSLFGPLVRIVIWC